MNEAFLSAFRDTHPEQTSTRKPHLWDLLKDISESKQTYSPVVQTQNMGAISIDFAIDDTRSRQVVRRSNYRMTGKQPSMKNDRMMHWESQNELNVFRLLEISPSVVSYREQPAVFYYTGADELKHKHYPDILVELACGSKLFIEVKSDRAIEDLNVIERSNLMEKLVRQKGYLYITTFPDQVESLSYLGNAKLILRYSKSPTPYPVKHLIRNYLKSHKNVTIQTLCTYLQSIHQSLNQEALGWIYGLLISGDIGCDLASPLEASTVLNSNLEG